MQDKALNRREFTAAAALALLGGAVITITGCGGGSGSPTGPSQGPGPGGVEGVVAANHGHRAIITAAQLSAGGALSLSIQGSADHNHVVQLTSDQVAAVRSGQRISVESSGAQAHSHTVTFN